ncbi:nuclear transport factor 2 family protein [Hyphococcus sp. DH-69]|uniref:nuclear transport factor 2 family protein n=1 Tax=Hyphococcus formosus TaxID=3143534 RepID=UPI00398AFABF
MKTEVEKTLKRWHEMVATKNLDELAEIIHPDAVFRSPVAHSPYHGRDALLLALSTVITVFEDFTYHREFVEPGGKDVVLEFSANVDGKQLKGADFIKFDDDGLIVEFEVMIRPASGLMALGQRMGAAIGDRIGEYK